MQLFTAVIHWAHLVAQDGPCPSPRLTWSTCSSSPVVTPPTPASTAPPHRHHLLSLPIHRTGNAGTLIGSAKVSLETRAGRVLAAVAPLAASSQGRGSQPAATVAVTPLVLQVVTYRHGVPRHISISLKRAFSSKKDLNYLKWLQSYEALRSVTRF